MKNSTLTCSRKKKGLKKEGKYDFFSIKYIIQELVKDGGLNIFLIFERGTAPLEA